MTRTREAQARVGQSTYLIGKAPIGKTGYRFHLVSEMGLPILVRRSNGQTFWATFHRRSEATKRARQVTAAGLPVFVKDTDA